MSLNGIFLVDKQSNISSFSTITKLKKKLNIDKIGHAGTLDPFADGLLIVLVGKATKLSDYLTQDDKSYIATIGLGKLFDTLDYTGTIIDTKEKQVTEKEVDIALGKLLLSTTQIPPSYSAKKVNGKVAYKEARKGKPIELKGSSITIYDLKRTSPLSDNQFSIYTRVTKGTYIRSMANDIGVLLGTYGYLMSLRRLSSGEYNVESSKTIEDIKVEDLIPIEQIFKDSDSYFINSEEEYKKVANGAKLSCDLTSLIIKVYYGNALIALYERKDGKYVVLLYI